MFLKPFHFKNYSVCAKYTVFKLCAIFHRIMPFCRIVHNLTELCGVANNSCRIALNCVELVIKCGIASNSCWIARVVIILNEDACRYISKENVGFLRKLVPIQIFSYICKVFLWFMT